METRILRLIELNFVKSRNIQGKYFIKEINLANS